MTKREFKEQLIQKLTTMHVEVDEKRINSTMDKLGRFLKTMGRTLDEEFYESGVANAICFFHEYKKKDTFNRDTYKNNRKN